MLRPLKVPRTALSLLNLGSQLILAGGRKVNDDWLWQRTYFWNNETLEFEDDQEIDAFPDNYHMEYASNTIFPLDYVREMCKDYL